MVSVYFDVIDTLYPLRIVSLVDECELPKLRKAAQCRQEIEDRFLRSLQTELKAHFEDLLIKNRTIHVASCVLKRLAKRLYKIIEKLLCILHSNFRRRTWKIVVKQNNS